MTLTEGRELLGVLLADPRVRVIEVAEYVMLRDHDLRAVRDLVALLAGALGPDPR